MTESQPSHCEILLPVFNGYQDVRRCLEHLQRHRPPGSRVRILDDASTDLRLIAYLDQLAERHSWLSVSRSARNLGFVGNVNRALSRATSDVVLLNSDTVVTGGWLERLLRCADSDPAIGIVCPLSNNATILSLPEMNLNNRIPAGLSIQAFADLVAKASQRRYPRLPVAVGFCMLIRHRLIDTIGTLHRAFELGYGEECDYSLRAWQAGFQVACCDDAFVFHQGERSFTAVPQIERLRERNAAVLERRWPGYDRLIQRWCQRNPLRAFQERLHGALCEARGDRAEHLLQVIHAFGTLGGTELHTQWVNEFLADHYRVTLLYPATAEHAYRDVETQEHSEFIRVMRYLARPPGTDEPHILGCRTALRDRPTESRFRTLIEAGKVRLVHFQHLLHWGSLALPLVAKAQGARVLLSLHDYFLMCPVFDLLGPKGAACGKPGADADDPDCLSCIATHSDKRADPAWIKPFLQERRALLEQVFAASDGLIAPSHYVREKFARLYGAETAARVLVIPHGIPSPKKTAKARTVRHPPRVVRLGIFANMNRRKGADVVISAVRLLADLPMLEVSHHGGVDHDYQEALIKSGIQSHGSYLPDQLPGRSAGIDLAIVPSIYEETYCLTIAELQALGIPVIAFAVGAVTERIRDEETGFLVEEPSAAALARRIRALVGQPHALDPVRRQLRHFSVKSITANAEEYLGLYRELIDQAPTGAGKAPTGVTLETPPSRPAEPIAELADTIGHPDEPTGFGYGDHDYRRWLSIPEGRIPRQFDAPARFAAELEILILDLGLYPEALDETLRSIEANAVEGLQKTVLSAQGRGDRQDGTADRHSDLAQVTLPDATDPTRRLNQQIASGSRRWILVLIAGVRLHQRAIALFAAYTQARTSWRFIYADDDLIAEDGHRYRPRFKPDGNLDLLRSQDYLGDAALIERTAFCRVGGFSRFPNAAHYDLCLRLIEQEGADHRLPSIGHIPHVLFHYADHPALFAQLAPDPDRCRKTLGAHLSRCGLNAQVETTDWPTLWWVNYRLPRLPRFSLVILSYGKGKEVAETINAFQAPPEGSEVLVLDFSRSGRIWPEIKKRGTAIGAIRVLPASGRQTMAAALNRAIDSCRHEAVVVIQDSVRPQRPDTLVNLLGLLSRPEVAMAGPCIVDPAERIVQSYPVTGFWPFGAIGQLHAGENLWRPGFLQRNLCIQDCATLSDRFYALRRSVFQRCSGFAQDRFPNAWYLLDFGLRLREAGYLSVWTPHAVGVELGEGSLHQWRRRTLHQDAIVEEVTTLLDHWLARLARDPAYNPNLSLRKANASPELSFKPPWETLIHQEMRILADPGDQAGSGHYRVIDPLDALAQADAACPLIPATIPLERMPSPVELERLNPTAVLLHNGLHDQHLHALELYRRYSSARLILSLDDLITNLPAWNPFCRTNHPDIEKRLARALACCDRLLVTTAELAECLAGQHADIRVVPNRLRTARWPRPDRSAPPCPRRSAKPRIGWAGAAQHGGDLDWLAPVVEALAGEAEWYFFGMCPKPLRRFATAILPMVDFPQYPHRLQAIALDIAVAPLAENDFNRCKSNLKVIEHGILGTCVLCSDLEPYRNAPVTRLPNQPRLWIEALRERISDMEATRREATALRHWVCEHYLLEGHLGDWVSALSP